MTPQAIAIAVFLAGAVLLFSGATPGLGDRLALLRNFVPLSVLELSHLLGSVVGVGLLIIAHGLYRRLHTAWWITIWLLCAGILLSLLKGFDYEEATILAMVVIMLASARSRFRRRASLIEQHYSTAWVAAFFLVLAMAAWLVLFAYRHLPYDNERRGLRFVARVTARAAAIFRSEACGSGACGGTNRQGRGHDGQSCTAGR